MRYMFMMLLASLMFVACGDDKAGAEKKMNSYKAEWAEIASVVDVEAVNAVGFDAWYDGLTNSQVRDLNDATDKLAKSYAEAENWYKNLSDNEQDAAEAVAVKWEKENATKQHQIEIMAEEMLDAEFNANDKSKCTMPVLKFDYSTVK